MESKVIQLFERERLAQGEKVEKSLLRLSLNQGAESCFEAVGKPDKLSTKDMAETPT